MQPIYVSKSLATASSTGLGSITAVTSVVLASVVTVNTSALDTPRRIQFSSTAGGGISSGVTFTVAGTIEGGGPKTETVYSSTGAAITTLDFATITSVSISSNVTIPISIGTNNTGGTRWIVASDEGAAPISGVITFSSSSNSMTGSIDVTYDDPTNTWPITRLGQQFPQPTVWGTSGVLTGATGAVQGLINLEPGGWSPIYAWRLTITSSSSSAGSVYATVLEAGP